MADASPPPGRRGAAHVRHLTGPLAGRSVTLRRRHVVFGTAAGCHVRFPAGTAGVAPEHFELNWDAGHYELRVNRRDPVYLNGRRAADGDEPTSDCTLQVGEGGPTLSVHLVVRPPLSRRAMAARVALAVLALALGAVAVRSVVDARARARREETLRLVQEALAARDAAARSTSWEAIAAATSPAVYLVVARDADPAAGESQIGTAWVAAPGRLATNAHVVAAVRDAQAAGRRVVVRASTAPHADIAVSGSVMHPAFEPFAAAWREYAPMRVAAGGLASPRDLVEGYDVGLLDVEAGAALAPPLPIATTETLRELRQGEPVAYLGYPSERLTVVDQSRPIPRLQTGTLVAFTTFTLTKPDADDAQLIEHSLPATGGASGSPIVNHRGEVVGLLSGGNIAPSGDGGRLPNAAQVNFGQRADVLTALLRDEPIDLAALRQRWSDDLQRYESPDRVIDRDMARLEREWTAEHGGPGAVQVVREERLTGPWTAQSGHPGLVLDLRLDPGYYMLLVRGDRRRDVNAALLAPLLFLPPTVLARDDEKDPYPILRHRVTTASSLLLAIQDAGPAPGESPGGEPLPVTLRVLRSQQ